MLLTFMFLALNLSLLCYSITLFYLSFRCTIFPSFSMFPFYIFLTVFPSCSVPLYVSPLSYSIILSCLCFLSLHNTPLLHLSLYFSMFPIYIFLAPVPPCFRPLYFYCYVLSLHIPSLNVFLTILSSCLFLLFVSSRFLPTLFSSCPSIFPSFIPLSRLCHTVFSFLMFFSLPRYYSLL